jgi:hypothetical protein
MLDVWGGAGRNPKYCCGNVLGHALWKSVWRFLKKLKMELPYDPALPLLGKYLKECKLTHNSITCTPIFIAALFTIAMLWIQSRCPTTDEWIKK